MFSSSWSRGPAFRWVVSLARWLVWWREPKCRCTNSPPPRTLRRRGCAALETWDLYKMDLTMTSQPEFGVWGWAWNRTGYRLMIDECFFGRFRGYEPIRFSSSRWENLGTRICHNKWGFHRIFWGFSLPCNSQEKVFLLHRPPKMVHHEITFFFFNKRITAVWEHVGNFGLQSPSIQLNCSCHPA